jgi:hypothetical protein
LDNEEFELGDNANVGLRVHHSVGSVVLRLVDTGCRQYRVTYNVAERHGCINRNVCSSKLGSRSRFVVHCANYFWRAVE